MKEKSVITENDIDRLAKGSVLEVTRDMIITPLAREYASRKGVRLVYSKGNVPSSEEIPEHIPQESLSALVASEVIAVLEKERKHTAKFSEANLAYPLVESPKNGKVERAIVVATGLNRPGIAAALTTAISDCGADIQDISQTIVSEFFCMIFVVNLSGIHEKGMNFLGFKEKIETAGKQINSEVFVMHEAILRTMHRI